MITATFFWLFCFTGTHSRCRVGVQGVFYNKRVYSLLKGCLYHKLAGKFWVVNFYLNRVFNHRRERKSTIGKCLKMNRR